jgi:microcystin-dependent protein
MSFQFAPKGWALCNGQTMQINQNQALFSLLGTSFGGDGRVNFKLPDLRDRIPLHVGNGHTLGEIGGSEAVTLNQGQMPIHPHTLWASSADGDTNLPSGEILAGASNVYGPPNSLTTLVAGTTTNAGGSQPHSNLQPYLTISFCIALQGIFPSPN